MTMTGCGVSFLFQEEREEEEEGRKLTDGFLTSCVAHCDGA